MRFKRNTTLVLSRDLKIISQDTHLLLTCGLSRAACPPPAPPPGPPGAEGRDELGGLNWEEEERLDSPE